MPLRHHLLGLLEQPFQLRQRSRILDLLSHLRLQLAQVDLDFLEELLHKVRCSLFHKVRAHLVQLLLRGLVLLHGARVVRTHLFRHERCEPELRLVQVLAENVGLGKKFAGVGVKRAVLLVVQGRVLRLGFLQGLWLLAGLQALRGVFLADLGTGGLGYWERVPVEG